MWLETRAERIRTLARLVLSRVTEERRSPRPRAKQRFLLLLLSPKQTGRLLLLLLAGGLTKYAIGRLLLLLLLLRLPEGTSEQRTTGLLSLLSLLLLGVLP